MIAVKSGYLGAAYADNEALLAKATHALRDVEFDTMVGTGLSGSLIIPVIARALGKNWLIIRKESESAHSSERGEGNLGDRWVFVDDFVDTGATKRRVKDAVAAIVADNCNYIAPHGRTNYTDGLNCPISMYLGDYMYSAGIYYPCGWDNNGW